MIRMHFIKKNISTTHRVTLPKIVSLFLLGTTGLFSHMAIAKCNGSIDFNGPVDFGPSITVKKSDPVGTVLKRVSANISMNAQCTPVYHPSAVSHYKIGKGAATSTILGACPTDIPGIGIAIHRTVNDARLVPSGPTRAGENCAVDKQYWVESGNTPAPFSIDIQPSDVQVLLVKIDDSTQGSFTLQGNIFSYMNSVGKGTDQVKIGLYASSTAIYADTPACTIAASANRVVNLGTVNSNTLSNSGAAYTSFDIPFDCEPNAKLNDIQLMVDGSGTSAGTDGLITPDSTSTAKNVLVEITDTNKKRIPFKQNLPVTLDGNRNLPLNARLFANQGAVITPGKVNASVTLTLTQK